MSHFDAQKTTIIDDFRTQQLGLVMRPAPGWTLVVDYSILTASTTPGTLRRRSARSPAAAADGESRLSRRLA